MTTLIRICPFILLAMAWVGIGLSPPAMAGTGIVVTTLADELLTDGQCSLREAIINANNNDQSGSIDCFSGTPQPDEILFDSGLMGGTLVLSNGALPMITESLAVAGPQFGDPGSLTVDAGGLSRIFHAQGGSPSDFTLVLSGMSLINGQTVNAQQPGGAVFADQADLWLDGVEVRASQALGFQSFGGGVAVRDGNLEINDSRVIDNHTVGNGAGGGGLSVTGNLVMRRTLVYGNTSTGDQARGGGLVVGGDGLVETSTIAENTTEGTGAHGGGLAVVSGDLDLVNSTVSGNLVNGPLAEGGGIHSASGDVLLRHSTLAFNQAAAGGVDGLWRGGTAPADPLTLHNSLLVQDRDGETACSGAADVHGGTISTDTSCTGSATPVAAIGLLPLTDSGGPTPTHPFEVPSAALNSAADCEANFGITEDQRGQPRPGRGSTACDMGAWEYQAPFCVSTSVELQQALNQAAQSGIDDQIRVAVGHYPVPDTGFYYNGGAGQGDRRDLEVSGGWVQEGANACGQRPSADPYLTVLDGQANDPVFVVNLQAGSRLHMEALHFTQGLATAQPAGGLWIQFQIDPGYPTEVHLQGNAFTANQGSGVGALHMDLADAGSGSRIRVNNNVFIGNLSSSQPPGAAYIAAYRLTDPQADLTIEVIGNTVMDNHFGQAGFSEAGGLFITRGTGVPTRVINNLLWNNQGNDLWLPTDDALDYRHNNVESVNVGALAPTGPGNLSIAPQFEDCAACPWLVPAAGSALIGAGTLPLPDENWQIPLQDASGRSRLVGGQIDIGAFENPDVLFHDRFE